jgi:uncharacterized protein (TIGR01777 family)
MGPDVRVGVTGASGLIGRSLVDALRERGDATTTFVRPSTKSVTGDVIRWDPQHGDVDDGDLRRVGGLDAVVHLAGAGIGDRRWTTARRREILASRVDSTLLLARAMGELSSSEIFLASGSAIGWYGARGEEVLDESSPAGKGFLSDVCQQWEDATMALLERGVAVAHLRTGLVVSSNGGIVGKQLPLFRLGLGARLATGRQWMSPISLWDQVRAILWIIDHRIIGPVNLSAPQPLSNTSFTKLLAHQVHRPAFLSVPAVALRAAFGSQMADELLLASQRVLPKVLLDSGFTFAHPNGESALKWALTTEK